MVRPGNLWLLVLSGIDGIGVEGRPTAALRRADQTATPKWVTTVNMDRGEGLILELDEESDNDPLP